MPKAKVPSKERPAKVDPEAQRLLVEAEAKRLGLTVLNWPPEKLVQFARGSITLAELQGISKEELGKMAEVGSILLSQGKLDDAQKIFMGLAVFNPYEAYFPLALGGIAQKRNELALAEQYYSRAIEINSSLTAALTNRAEVRLLLGRLSDSIGDLVRSAAQSLVAPNDASSHRAQLILNAIKNRVNELQSTEEKS